MPNVEATIERLEAQLSDAERTLQDLCDELDQPAAEELSAEVAARMAEHAERLQSQLLAVTQPPDLKNAFERLGVDAVSKSDFESLRPHMAPPDREG